MVYGWIVFYMATRKQAAYKQATREPGLRTQLPLPADLNRGPLDWESLVFSTEPQQLLIKRNLT